MSYTPHSPVKHGSPIKSYAKAMGGSPIASPLKQPRESTYTGATTFTPLSRDEVIGKPVEIIQGK